MRAALRTLRPYLAPEWPALALAMLSTLAVVAAWLARPLPIALVVDRLLAEREIPFDLDGSDWRFVGLLAGLVLAIAVVGALGSHLADDRLTRAGEHITHRLRVATYAQLQRLSMSFHEARHAGELVTRVTGDVSAVGGLFPGALGNLASATTLLLGMLAVSLIIDPLLALTAFAAAPALAFVSFRFRRRVISVARRQRAKESEIVALSEESFSAMRVVKSLGAERFEEERLRLRSEELRDLELEATGVEGRFSGITDLLGAVALALVLVVGILRVAAGAVTPGELVIMWTYARRIDRPLRAMARSGNRLARGLTRAERVAEILAADDFLEERPDAYSGPRARGELELHEVSFSYDPGRPALVDLTLRVPAGERLALVGRSGAGKSTLAALIARFYDPPAQRGRVSLDGRDLRDCALAWLRDQVGLVLQDTVLFSGTVAENIAYGLDATREDVVRAAKAAGAHAFLAELPEGYDTLIGQRGVGLSGGERQRIAIARALLRDPPVLVLDEPTTGLDAESEAHVMDGLDALMRGRTTIIITHAPRLAARADRVVVVEAGRIARDGPPELVLAEEGTGRRARRRAGPGLVPADPALPQLADVLDPEVMAEVLARSLEPGARVPDVRIRYLRYKPETNLVVHYDVGVAGRWHHATAMIARSDLARRARKPENQALADLVDGRSPAERPLSYEPAVGALVQWLPLDLSLWALAVPPDQRDRRLRSAGVLVNGGGEEPSLLAYKPRRRAVVRLDGHVLKYYASHASHTAAVTGLRAAAEVPGVRTPGFEASLPDLLVTVQPYVSGPGFASAVHAAEQAGLALARLHAADPRAVGTFPPGAQLDTAAASARLVGRIVPRLRPRLDALLARLESGRPAGLAQVPVHGDFNVRQLVDGPDGLVMTDFDAMCAAPAALDVATYLAYMVRGDPSDLDAALGVLDPLLDGYGEQPRELSWYLATMLLRRSPRPFRYQDERWPDRVEQIVAAAERAYA